MSSKYSNVSKKVFNDLSMFIFDVTNYYPSYPKKNQEQNFRDQTLTSFFQIYWPYDKRIKKY